MAKLLERRALYDRELATQAAILRNDGDTEMMLGLSS
jgi:hypothetical protein